MTGSLVSPDTPRGCDGPRSRASRTMLLAWLRWRPAARPEGDTVSDYWPPRLASRSQGIRRGQSRAGPARISRPPDASHPTDPRSPPVWILLMPPALLYVLNDTSGVVMAHRRGVSAGSSASLARPVRRSSGESFPSTGGYGSRALPTRGGHVFARGSSVPVLWPSRILRRRTSPRGIHAPLDRVISPCRETRAGDEVADGQTRSRA